MADNKTTKTQTVMLQDPSPFTKGLGLGLPAPIPAAPADVVGRIVNQPLAQPSSQPTTQTLGNKD